MTSPLRSNWERAHAFREAVLALAPGAHTVRIVPIVDRFRGWTAMAYDRDLNLLPVESPGQLADLVMRTKQGMDWDTYEWVRELHVTTGIIRPLHRVQGGEEGEERL